MKHLMFIFDEFGRLDWTQEGAVVSAMKALQSEHQMLFSRKGKQWLKRTRRAKQTSGNPLPS